MNFVSTIIFLEEDKKKLINNRDSVIKRNKDFLDSKLKISVSTLKSDLDKTNFSLQCMIVGKSKFDEILGVQMVRNKHEGFGFAKHVPILISTPSTLKAAPTRSFCKHHLC